MKRAHEATLIDPSRPIAVIGAGAAGVSAALLAATGGIATTLIERDSAFWRQRHCHTRRLEPTLYDWPAAHWLSGIYPWRKEYAPLSYSAASAASVVAEWKRRYRTSIPDLLTYAPHATLQAIVRTSDTPPFMYQVRYTDDNGDQTRNVAMVITAMGPGLERITQGAGFRSLRFWDSDPLASQPLAANGRALRRVLIAGSGDGAMQDFLRLVLQPDADLTQFVDALRLDATILGRVQTLAAQADANFIWSANEVHEHRSERFANEELRLVADECWTEHARRVFTMYARPAETIPLITIVHPCDHWARGFPVNRLLSQLALRWCDENGVKTTTVSNAKVSNVTCPDVHDTAEACVGSDHAVTLTTAYCCAAGTDGPAREWTTSDTYDLVLFRIGVDAEKSLSLIPTDASIAQHRRQRQVLPFHLAHEDYSSLDV